jgi:MFS superfamily sulfate permease-like transporter
LSSQGWQEITTAPPWHPIAGAGGPDAGFFRGVVAAELVEVLLPFAVLACLATVRRLWRAWPILLIAMILTATLGALFWHLLRTAANQLG